jgi:hypothetical protein
MKRAAREKFQFATGHTEKLGEQLSVWVAAD